MDMQNPRRGNGTGCENHRADEGSQSTPTLCDDQLDLTAGENKSAASVSQIGEVTSRVVRRKRKSTRSELADLPGTIDKRKFYCQPVRILRDKRLTLLDTNVLGAIALHDGMSLEKGKGRGCYASLMTIKSTVGYEYTAISKSITKLIKLGYLDRSPNPDDGRRSIYRVIYTDPDSCSDGQPSSVDVDGDLTNNTSKVVGTEFSETRKEPVVFGRHYISLNERKESTRGSKQSRGFYTSSDFGRELPGRKPDRAGPISPYTVGQGNIAVLLTKVERDLKNRCSEIDLSAWHKWLTEIAASTDNLEFEGERASDWAKRLLDLPHIVEFSPSTSNDMTYQNSERGA